MMKQDQDIDLNSKVPIDTERLMAFWKPFDAKGTGEKHEKLDDLIRASAFRLGSLGSPHRPANPHKGEKFVLGNRSWFARLKSGADDRKLSFWAVEAFFYCFGIDLSKAGVLNRRVVRRFNHFWAEPLLLRRVSNHPDKQGRDCYEVTLPYFSATNTELRIERSNGDYAGTIMTWLSAFQMEISGGERIPKSELNYLRAGVKDDRGYVAEYYLNKGTNTPGTWDLRSEDTEKQVRNAVGDDIVLCALWLSPGDHASLTCTARQTDIRYVFTEPGDRKETGAKAVDNFGKQAVAQFLKQRRQLASGEPTRPPDTDIENETIRKEDPIILTRVQVRCEELE